MRALLAYALEQTEIDKGTMRNDFYEPGRIVHVWMLVKMLLDRDYKVLITMLRASRLKFLFLPILHSLAFATVYYGVQIFVLGLDVLSIFAFTGLITQVDHHFYQDKQTMWHIKVWEQPGFLMDPQTRKAMNEFTAAWRVDYNPPPDEGEVRPSKPTAEEIRDFRVETVAAIICIAAFLSIGYAFYLDGFPPRRYPNRNLLYLWQFLFQPPVPEGPNLAEQAAVALAPRDNQLPGQQAAEDAFRRRFRRAIQLRRRQGSYVFQ